MFSTVWTFPWIQTMCIEESTSLTIQQMKLEIMVFKIQYYAWSPEKIKIYYKLNDKEITFNFSIKVSL